MYNLFLILIIIIIFLYLVKPTENNYQPNQQEIQEPTYINEKQFNKDYPYPQISREFRQLSNNLLTPLDNLSDILPNGNKELMITKNNQTPEIGKKRMYLPDYYRKDRLSQNPIGTEELRPFINNKDKSEQSWTDINVSEHPKFYNADIKDELTNIGAFFDKNNQYNDKTSSNTNSLTSDSCYTDTMGNSFCEDKTRLQLIPPKLISDPESSYALNKIGIYKDENLKENFNKVMYGDKFYNGVSPSQEINEDWSSPIKDQVGNCAI